MCFVILSIQCFCVFTKQIEIQNQNINKSQKNSKKYIVFHYELFKEKITIRICSRLFSYVSDI